MKITIEEKKSQESISMSRTKGRSRGFTLVASLLVLALLSAIAVSLLFMVQGSGQVGGNDLETNRAYYGAESGMELLTANLAALYQQSQAPTPAQITNLTNSPPDSTMIASMNYQESITWTPDANGNPASHTSIISSGPSAGLTAQIIPLTLKVVATRPGGASVNMTRGVEVALIPVFQFGVFSDSDLSYFAGPPFSFQGRVHTNGNLFLAANSGPLILDAKTTAVGEIIRDRLANNYSSGGAYQGDVYVPNASGGCDPPNPTTNANCLKFTIPLASWSGGIPPAGTQTNPTTWTNTSTQTFKSFIGNNTSMGVQPLTLPFVQGANGAAQQIAIIRKALPGESATSSTGSSREFNKANIRVLLASTEADLVPDRLGLIGDPDNIALSAPNAAPANGCVGTRTDVVTGVGTTPWAMAQTGTAYTPSWVGSPTGPGACPATNPWPLIDGWLRVEYKNAAGNWIGTTRNWLQLGFARGTFIPTTPVGGAGANNVHPNAILIFQQIAGDRNLDGVINATDGPQDRTVVNGNSQFSWYPINFFDPREGFPRDANPGLAGSQCYVNGIMNAVELDVGNLRQWVLGNIGVGGTAVDYTGQNGYLVFFSDRRGMLPDPNGVPTANVTSGEYGFEDVINSGSPTGTPDGAAEPLGPTGYSPEDVDENNLQDNWGAANVGNGMRIATVGNPYKTVDCLNGGRQNIVTGARHVLRLVDGGLGNLPLRPDTGLGGFTVAAENPVYVFGNYNSDSTDPFWASPGTAADINHSAAAVIADSVTLLSNGWSDVNSMANALNMGNRPATTTYYRLAIAGGKNMNFPNPAGTGADFGTDGGVHNFLRYIENWGGATLSYRGSLVSLYYSEYATGTFKCCTLVYSPPNRNYYFDSAFLDPSKLPPGTPMLQDVVNLTYWQDFKPY
jgi:hypothetical protein